jgi:hypothetical protein
MGSFSRLKHRHFTHHGVTYTFMGISPNGRAMFTDGAGAMLEVADPDTGMPVWPTEAQARDLMAERKLILRSNPLVDNTRALARKEELSRDDLVNAKTKQQSDDEKPKRRDPWYTLREETLHMTDEVGTPSLSVKGVRRFYEDHFDVADLEARFGRLPSAFTFRRWVRARGVPSDRRPDDFASSTGQVPRARKINSMVLAIIKFWALKYHTKPKQFKNAYFRKAKDDVERYAKGEALELHDFQDVELDAPKGVIKMCSRRIFDMEVERAKGSQAFKEAWGLAAVRQRYRGGGWSQEPTRFLEIVQLDDTPFPVFAVDPVRGVPCGVPTVTIALCIFTRVIVGWDISYDPPSHVTFMRTLLHTAVPKIVPEPFAKITELGDLHGKVVGVLLVDHAKHLSARAAQDAGGEIGTAVRWAGSKQPTHKGCVERCLKTLQDMICAELKGGTGTSPSCGSSTTTRPSTPP